MTGEEKRALRYGLSFISPWIVGFGFFLAFPMLLSAYFSVCDYSVLNPPAFIGTQNYQDLYHDEVFWTSLYNTLYFAAFSLPLGQVLAIALALLLNTSARGRGIFRTIYFLPALVPLVALGILWQDLLNADYGIVNQIIGLVGIPPIDWLGNPTYSKPAIVMTALWIVGHPMVLYLASLQEVPRSLYEAARVDGASSFQQMTYITLPMISPMMYFNLLMGSIIVLQEFVRPYVMTEGGPARSTMFYTYYLFNQAFVYLNMGYASAMAWVLFLIIAAVTYLAHLVSYRYVVYEGR